MKYNATNKITVLGIKIDILYINLSSYYIKLLNFFCELVQVKKTEDTKTEAKVEGLKEKMIYQFRVKAYNKAGVGDASEPTANHLCKHRNCKINIITLYLFWIKFLTYEPPFSKIF